jgi:hypothetical protein
LGRGRFRRHRLRGCGRPGDIGCPLAIRRDSAVAEHARNGGSTPAAEYCSRSERCIVAGALRYQLDDPMSPPMAPNVVRKDSRPPSATKSLPKHFFRNSLRSCGCTCSPPEDTGRITTVLLCAENS